MGFEELMQVLQSEWAIRALIASTLVGLMCGVLGCFIVLRNMALIGDALAHAILPGVVFAFMIVGYSTLGFFAGAVIAGLVMAVITTWIQQNVKTKNDASIGIVFTAMFSIGVMAISWISKDEGVHLDLKDFLIGNVMGVSDEDIYLTAAIAVYVIISIIVFYRYLFVTTFQPVIGDTLGISSKVMHYFLMLLLSFVVVASLRTVGMILVVAMLITPAATALLLSDRLRNVLFISAVVGVMSTIVGLLLAIMYNTTPAPAMVVIACVFYFAAALFSPKKGLVFKFFRKEQLKRKIQLEDILKQSLKLHEKGQLSLNILLDKLGFKKNILQTHLKTLQGQGLLNINNQQLQLTNQGITEANRLVRAHRLWETYLVEQMGLTEEQIHEEAEKYEHLLTEELLDQVDHELDYPTIDPHGSPIPPKAHFKADLALFDLSLSQNATISAQQLNNEITNELWQLGLSPNNTFTIQKKEQDFVEIESKGKKIKLPASLAKKINVSSK